jgi:putative PIN family toxin of toxin-antitoxin system
VRVVLDTNTVVSATLFPKGRLAWIRDLWTEGHIVPLVCPITARELVRVLSYPKFRLDEAEIQIALGAFLPYAEALERDPKSDLPRCLDPHDQIFLDLALVGDATVLASGDRAVPEMAVRVPFAIESAADFRKRFPDA